MWPVLIWSPCACGTGFSELISMFSDLLPVLTVLLLRIQMVVIVKLEMTKCSLCASYR